MRKNSIKPSEIAFISRWKYDMSHAFYTQHQQYTDCKWIDGRMCVRVGVCVCVCFCDHFRTFTCMRMHGEANNVKLHIMKRLKWNMRNVISGTLYKAQLQCKVRTRIQWNRRKFYPLCWALVRCKERSRETSERMRARAEWNDGARLE